jgi:hypothetical protein
LVKIKLQQFTNALLIYFDIKLPSSFFIGCPATQKCNFNQIVIIYFTAFPVFSYALQGLQMHRLIMKRIGFGTSASGPLKGYDPAIPWMRANATKNLTSAGGGVIII